MIYFLCTAIAGWAAVPSNPLRKGGAADGYVWSNELDGELCYTYRCRDRYRYFFKQKEVAYPAHRQNVSRTTSIQDWPLHFMQLAVHW